MTVDEIISQIIDREGKDYTDRDADRGGPTRYGVTLAALSEYRSAPCTAEDVKNLQEPEARALYRFMYVTVPSFHKIQNAQLQALVVDSGVQHGTATATKFLQAAAGTSQDGRLGLITLGVVNSGDQRKLYLRMYAERQRFYGQIISHDPELYKAVADGYVKLQARNALGWANRQTQLLEDCP